MFWRKRRSVHHRRRPRALSHPKHHGEWYKLWKDDGSATGFYLAELKCPHSYYDDNHYCAMEFRCYLDDSDPNDPTAFSYTLHDDC